MIFIYFILFLYLIRNIDQGSDSPSQKGSLKQN